MSKPQLNQIDRNYIGPPDKLSNLRPILRHASKDETPLDRELRLKQIEVEEWNQRFWQTHNQKFIKVSCPLDNVQCISSNWKFRSNSSFSLCFQEKEAFILANKDDESDTLSADKMSEFYKKFLDENWQTHFNYNQTWYKYNFDMLLLSFRTKFQLNRLFDRKNLK